MIRWSHGDYVKLGKAVSNFNKQISKNETEANRLYLPETIDYKELRDRIQTREGLNAYLQQLKRINIPGAFNLETLENGVLITKYQKGELDRSRSQAINQLTQEVAEMEKKTKADYGVYSDIALPNAFKTAKQKELEAKLKDFRELYKLSGKDFKKRAKQLMINQTELKFRRAYIFRQNYMKVMREKYSLMKDFWLFERWANKHKNPIDFFDSLPEDESYFPNDLYRHSDETLTEEEFQGYLEAIGINVEEEYQAVAERRGITVDELKQEKLDKVEKKAAQRIEKLFK